MKNRKQALLYGWMVIFLFIWFSAVSSAQDSGQTLTGDAWVLDASVRSSGSSMLLDVKVELGDACTRIGEITQTISDTTITVQIQTARPADAMCAMVLTIFETTIPLNTAGLAAGDYTVQVNNRSVTVAVGAMEAQAAAADSCPAADAENNLFLAPGGEYCFLYPADLQAEELEDGSILVASDPLIVPGISLLIVAEPAGGRMLDEIAAQRQQQAQDVTIQFDAATIGGTLALVTEDIPGPAASRVALLLQEDILYTVTLQPLDEFSPETTAAAEALWERLAESFLFLNGQPATSICPQASDDQAVFSGSGLCFAYPAGYDLINSRTQILLSDPQTGATVLLLTLSEAESGTLADSEARMSQTYPDADLQFEQATFGGINALIVDGIPGSVGSRMGILLVGNQYLTLILQPVDDALPEESGAALALWDVVAETLAFTGE